MFGPNDYNAFLALHFVLAFSFVFCSMATLGAFDLASRISKYALAHNYNLGHILGFSTIAAFTLAFLAAAPLYYMSKHYGDNLKYPFNGTEKEWRDAVRWAFFWWSVALPVGAFLTLNAFAPPAWVEYRKEIKRREQMQEILQAYGSKDWASPDRIFGVLKNGTSGVYIGSGFHFNEQGNILTVGGPRGGKGINLILPALLDSCLIKPNAQSWVILDPKGENCAVAGAYLKWAGYKVHVINPFGIPEISQFGNSKLNVFDLFNIYTPTFASFVDMVINSLMPETQKEDDFFTPSGRELLRFHIGYMMLQDKRPKNFRTLYDWLHFAGEERIDLLDEMLKCTGLDGIVRAGAKWIVGLLDDKAEKTVAGIYGAAKLGISVFGDTQLRYSVDGSDFTLQNIAKEKTAIFVCVNPSELNRTKAWLRILFNSFIDNMLRNYNAARKTVFLFDELHKLGSLKVVKDNISYLPGYHVTIWSIVQSLGQLKDLYPDIWEDFVGSSTVRHYLSIQDNFTAEYVSKRMPQTIKFVGSHPDGSPKEIRVPLLSQDEIIGRDDIILEINGMDRPALINKLPYWKINDHGAPNPFR